MKPLSVLVLFILVNTLTAQVPFTARLKVGTNALQETRRIIHTPDSNFLVVGYLAGTQPTTSLDRDALVFKMTPTGSILWAKRYGGSNWEELYDVAQVGNYYYCVGYTRSFFNGRYPPLPANNVNADVFLMKLNLDGTLVWAKNMGRPSNGTSSTDGNDIGFRLIGSAQGGVVIVVRINSGNNTNQNGGLIWVDANGKTKWAYQYDLTSNIANNELTFSIWKDKADQYITGGWIQTSGTPFFTGGIMYKVDQTGKLLWDKNIRTNPTGTSFESLYYGYYNHKNQKIYSTDFYTQVSGSIREMQVCTNKAFNGEVPTAGSIPQAMRFHYGAPASVGNNFRTYIFPVGDGYEQFILAGNDNSGATANTTKYATLISADEELGFQWAKKIGATKPAGTTGYLNHIFDMVTCDGDNQNLLCVGTLTKSDGNKEILICRTTASATLDTCNFTAAVNDSSLTETHANLNLQRINLNTVGCGNSCWADDDLINNASITISNVTPTVTTDCAESAELIGGIVSQASFTNFNDDEVPALNFIVPNVSSDLAGGSDLSFTFNKPPKEVYFEITDARTGDFVYERFFGDLERLMQGFNFAGMNMPSGEYVWEIEAVYDDEQGIERKVGEFVID